MYLFTHINILPNHKNNERRYGMKDKNKDKEMLENKMSSHNEGVPFDTIEDLWFWFIVAQQARNDGARYVSGAGLVRRPCEPVDILKILDDLYRKRRLLREHLLVLRHYGRRHLAPDPNRAKEARSYYLWKEALERMRPVLERKGIILKESWVSQYISGSEGCAMPTIFPNLDNEGARVQ